MTAVSGWEIDTPKAEQVSLAQHKNKKQWDDLIS